MDIPNSCKFAEELVSYLYSELNESETALFESHLAGCNSCSSELGDLSFAHSSIAGYKTIEFDHLPTPAIEIDYSKHSLVSPLMAKIETEPVSRPWFAAVRDLFTLSPTWATAATAFGALVIGLGIFYFAVNSRNQQPVAKDTNPTPVLSPTVENATRSPEPTVSKDEFAQMATPKPTPANNLSEATTSGSDDVKVTPAKAPATTPQNKKTALKAKDKSVKPEASEKPSKPQPKEKRLQPAPDTDDEEDDTLRLADMFEEITASTTR